MAHESPDERAVRRRRRLTFDAVADLYERSRRGYPEELLDVVVATAGLTPGSAILEVGCGTGQLTRQLVTLPVDVTAIDIAPAMVALASSVVVGGRARFATCAFEHFEAPSASFDLVVSATAFHWIDPEVRFVKAAELLRPGGWLALLGTGEDYDDPFGSSLRALWTGLVPRSAATGATAPTDAEAAMATGLFDSPLVRRHARRLALHPDDVAAVERTRATVLDYEPEVRRRYDRGLDALLAGVDEIPLTQRTSLTMVQRRGSAAEVVDDGR